MSRVNIGVLISGGGSNLQSIIDDIESKKIDGQIGLVISNKEDAYGLVRAREAGINTLFLDRKKFSSEEDYNLKIIEELIKRDIELVVLAGYLRVLTENFIKEFENKIINIHPSLIPSFSGKGFYGERVHKKVLEYGVKITGATVHFVDEGADTGPIIAQEVVYISDDETLDSLKAKVLELEHKLLPKVVRLYCQDRISINGRKVTIN